MDGVTQQNATQVENTVATSLHLEKQATDLSRESLSLGGLQSVTDTIVVTMLYPLIFKKKHPFF
ncbi:MAG: hypothetical protein ACI9WC_003161 [Arenicella sp.]|jgi:hypothetical protein